jgi:adenosylcobyric acid synthase
MALGRLVHGYEIHYGRVSARRVPAFIEPGDGARAGNVFGTHWHGTFESDGYRRAFLTEAARLAGRDGFQVAPDANFAARREQVLDLMADLVEEHLDTRALERLIDAGPPRELPFLPPGAP